MAIPTEDNYVDWFLRGAVDYFETRGFTVRTYSVGQVNERVFPVDRILAIDTKIVGFQMKRPISVQPLRFDTTPHQHQLIRGASWIFYCLPEFDDWDLQRAALHHYRFVRGEEDMPPTINEARHYMRWGALAAGLIACPIGVKLQTPAELDKIIRDVVEHPKDVFLVLNIAAKTAAVLNDPQLQTKK